MAREGKGGRSKLEFAGAVFAGGESRRMGREKALLRAGGIAMWRRQAEVLRRAGAEPVVILRRQGQSALGRGGRWALPHLRDQFADAGPLAGLHAALAGTERPFVAVLAVDMPEIDAAWFRWLGGFCHDDCGAVVRHHDGYEPLAAIYPRGALATVTRRLQRRALSMQEMVRGLVRAKKLTAVVLPERERWRVKNWNRPADRKRGRASGRLSLTSAAGARAARSR